MIWYHPSCGLSMCNVVMCDAVFSDHRPVLCDISLPCDVQHCKPVRYCRVLHSTAARFSAAFSTAADNLRMEGTGPENLIGSFYPTCLNILDTIAPVKKMRAKNKTEQWLTLSLRLAGVNAEGPNISGKQDKLQISSDILKDCWVKYKKNVQQTATIRAHYLTPLILL